MDQKLRFETRRHLSRLFLCHGQCDHGLLKKELSEDGLHPNKAGYEVMAPLAEKAITEASAKKK
jgi:lysophospholipase L1-like esterase